MPMLCKSETEKPCIKSADKTKDTAKVMGVDVGDDCENDGSGKQDTTQDQIKNEDDSSSDEDDCGLDSNDDNDGHNADHNNHADRDDSLLCFSDLPLNKHNGVRIPTVIQR